MIDFTPRSIVDYHYSGKHWELNGGWHNRMRRLLDKTRLDLSLISLSNVFKFMLNLLDLRLT